MSTYSALLYSETNALVLIILFILLFNTYHNHALKLKFPSYLGFLFSLIFLAAEDIIWAFVDSGILPNTDFLGYFTNLAYFAGTFASVFFLFMISRDIFGYESKTDYYKKAWLFSIPLLIDFIFVMLTPITHLVFKYENGVYSREKYYTITLCVPYIYVLYMCVSSFLKSYLPKYFYCRRSLKILTIYSLITMAFSLFALITTYIFPLYVVGGTIISVLIFIDAMYEINSVDSLTGLYNYRALETRLTSEIQSRDKEKCGFYLVLCDLDDLRSINLIYGLEEGDNALIDAAKIIKSETPSDWFTARFSGDKFALLGECDDTDIDTICANILQGFDDYNMSSRKPYTLSVSIGYAALSPNFKNITDFIQLAEKRLHDSSQNIKGKHALVKNNIAKSVQNSASTEPAPITQQDINLWMNSALKNGEFIPYFQPQINTENGTISGAEALARWIHPEKGLIYPSIFIPVFERNGFIYEMDKAIWRAVCKQIREWKDAGVKIPTISVNVSRWDIVQSDLITTLMSYLNEFDIKPEELHLEITESAYLYDQDYLFKLMQQLQKLGFVIEMDDFGSGYSSLTAFKDLPFNIIKMDSSLLRDTTLPVNDRKSEGNMLADVNKAGNILAGIVRLTTHLEMPVIAEGVETLEQVEFLKNVNCYTLQGYYFAKPMPADQFTQFIKNWDYKKALAKK